MPRPFAGVLRAIEHALNSSVGSVHIGIGSGDVSGDVLLAIAGVIVLAGAVIVAQTGVRGRLHEARREDRREGGCERSARAIGAMADAAERSGDFDGAVRLRFEAGLARLAEQGTISRPSVVRAAQLRRKLRSSRFDSLNGNFEAVAYGGQHADAELAAAARTDWQRLLEEEGAL